MQFEKDIQRSRSLKSAGFTLVELMTASAVGLAVTAGSITLMVNQRAYHTAHRQLTDARQNTSYAITTVSRDVRMAGYGLNIEPSELDEWVNWIPGFTSNPLIEDGANGAPDGMLIAGAFERGYAELVSGITTGDTTMTVMSLDGSDLLFNDSNNKILFLGKNETVRISHPPVGAGSIMTLSISTDPSTIDGVRFAYPAGTRVELVKMVQYEWVPPSVSSMPYPYLTRRDLSESIQLSGLWEVSSAYIDDFQVDVSGGAYFVRVTGITEKLDKDYLHPNKNDHYRRTTMTTKVSPRN